jgi:hypothetical protein
MAEKNYFEVLNNIDVGDKIEKKNGLSYLSWAWAWGEIKKRHPDAIYTIYENADGLFYHTDGKTAWVKTGVTVNGIEHIEYLPVMDYKNKSIPIEDITSTDVNKAIQRSLTKAVARHGLGLYIYAGEDLPEEKKGTTDKEMDDHLEKKISANDVKIIEKMVEGKDALKTWVLQQCNVTKFEDMTNAQYGQAMRALNEHFEKKGK